MKNIKFYVSQLYRALTSSILQLVPQTWLRYWESSAFRTNV